MLKTIDNPKFTQTAKFNLENKDSKTGVLNLQGCKKGMIMYVRLKVLKDKKPKEYALSKKYFNFLKSRTKEKTFEERKKLKFKN